MRVYIGIVSSVLCVPKLCISLCWQYECIILILMCRQPPPELSGAGPGWLSWQSWAPTVTRSLAGRTSTFGSGSNREDKVETPVNSGPDPCLPEICDKMSVRQTHSLALFLFFLMQMLFMSGWHLDPWEMVFVPFSHPWHRRQSFLWVDCSTSDIRLQVRSLSLTLLNYYSVWEPWLTD